MSSPIRPVCIKCQKEYKVKKSGVITELMTTFGGKPASFELYDSDLWECPGCGHQIIGGFGQKALAQHFEEDYQEVLKRVSTTSQVFKCY